MALSRKFLKELLAEYENRDEMIDKIIDAHAEEIAPYKAELKRMEEQTGYKDYETLHAAVEKMEHVIEYLKSQSVDENGVPWSVRADEMHEKYEAEKAKYEGEKAHEIRRKAFDNILSSCGIPYEHRKMIFRAERDVIAGLEIADGKVKNAHGIEQAIRSEYGGLIKNSVPGVSYNRSNPVSITSITDRNERMKARSWQNGIISKGMQE